MAEEDAAQLQELIARPRSEATAAEAKAPPPEEAGAGAAAPAERKPLPACGASGWQTTDVRGLLPAAAGVSCSKETKWHRRWRAAAYGRNYSACYGGAISEATAARQVLLWCWDLHTAATGEQCPWDL